MAPEGTVKTSQYSEMDCVLNVGHVPTACKEQPSRDRQRIVKRLAADKWVL
jgi:hypothetical protein